ncbi:Phospholipid/glycerol acyltransferase [Cynara cardunculus var. scolymus]|uniref:Phospholipid/glycerol acyltransferase n=1 Tax=Cynara cardunculus var. scolymus TaxID=59895 RepID=A0A103XF24_CYNCS|nr:Phospholipid/glycerol acyltransferase [Cynara cardunculus var. scolymus]
MDRKMLQHLFFLYKFVLKLLGYPQGQHCKNRSLKYMRYESMADKHRSEELLKTTTLVFEVEGGLLRSTSLFPYFMLVAFEGGGVLRGLVLFLLYPLVCLVSREMGLKIMVFICFFGVKKGSFVIGRTVLPKFFMEDLGFEGFEVVMRFGRKVGLSELPRVMVEGFLKDYLGVDCVFGRDLKVVCGYFVGLMEEEVPPRSRSRSRFSFLMNDVFGERKDKYPKPLIFHDGRIAFMPTFPRTLAMIMWVPFGFGLSLLRIIVAISFPYIMSIPVLSFTGLRGRPYIPSTTENNHKKEKKDRGTLYVCNHRTLLDPIYISLAIMKPLRAVTYSLSPLSEFLSPIKTSHLSRNKEKDSKMMDSLLSQGDLVVCPEGTTCREPYVLRFSPLFAEISNEIVPVALDAEVSMFYGTTASGLKFLDPVFFLMNPIGVYHIMILENLLNANARRESSIETANRVQKQIADALGFQCTNLTRRDKYMILAGNEGAI